MGRKYVITAAGGAGVLAAASFFLLRTGASGRSTAEIVLADLLLYLLLSIVLMALALRRSLQETIYSYANIGLIGGILFAAVLIIVLISFTVQIREAAGLSLREVYRVILDFPRQFSFRAVFVLAALCVLLGISNVALIRHEGFCLNNALSLLVAAFYLGGTAAIYLLSEVLTRCVFLPRGLDRDPLFLTLNNVIPLFFLLMLCYFECILVGSAVMGWKASRQIPAYDKDYIIILGCSIDRRGGLLPLLKGRVNRAIRFAWDQEIATGKSVHYVPSGGQGPNEVMSEGSAMELYLMSRGAEDYEILPEKKSRSTWENMCFSKEIIDAVKPGAKVAFATTNYHMLRSGILARAAGLDAEGIAGDTKWYFWPNGFVREFFGILALNIRTHVAVAVAAALACTALGFLGYFGGLA